MKLNKKAEVRIHHIIISVLVMSLFGIFLFNLTTTFVTDHSNGTISIDNLTSPGREGNRTNFFNTVSDLNNITSELTGISQNAPGGSDSSASSDAVDAEGNLFKAGYNFISNIGLWLFKYPAAMINGILGFFGLPREFAGVATTILFVVVAIILISSILKNRI